MTTKNDWTPEPDSNCGECHPLEQPETFTPGLTKGMVRQHAYTLYRDKLVFEPLTLRDWVLAEKDLLHTLETDNLVR